MEPIDPEQALEIMVDPIDTEQAMAMIGAMRQSQRVPEKASRGFVSPGEGREPIDPEQASVLLGDAVQEGGFQGVEPIDPEQAAVLMEVGP